MIEEYARHNGHNGHADLITPAPTIPTSVVR